jgi:ribonuclease HI
VAQAVEGADQHPIFWFRGLVPKGWTKRILEGRDPTFETQAGGCLEEANSAEPHVMDEGDIMATDGSGGCYPTNTTLRRVGWGLSVAKSEGEPIGWARGGIAGEQTVPRAELAAVLAGVQQTSGPLTIWSDSAYVVLGASKGWGIKMTNNQDLWGAVRERLANRPGIVQIIKVKGHATPLDVKKGLSTARQAFMNDCADTQAGLGASKAQLPPNVAKSVEALMAMATKVHKRLAEVAQTRFGEKRKEFVKPPRPNGPTKTVPRWEQVFLSRASTSEHKVFRYGPHRSEARCSICSKGGKVRSAGKWLLTKCTTRLHEGVDGQALHASHSMAHRQGVRICQVCGCYSVKRVVKLLKPCEGQAAGIQKADLERWSKGLPPKRVGSWPLEADGADRPH